MPKHFDKRLKLGLVFVVAFLFFGVIFIFVVPVIWRWAGKIMEHTNWLIFGLFLAAFLLVGVLGRYKGKSAARKEYYEKLEKHYKEIGEKMSAFLEQWQEWMKVEEKNSRSLETIASYFSEQLRKEKEALGQGGKKIVTS